MTALSEGLPLRLAGRSRLPVIGAAWRRGVLLALAALALAAGAPREAAAQPAQEWPSAPIRLVVPLTAGGVSDVLARALAERLSGRLGQPVHVENRPGAKGDIAIEHVARVPADGHTLLMVPTMLAVNPSLGPTRYDPSKDFAPVTLLGETSMTLVVSNRLGVSTPAELAAMLDRPGVRLICGSAGGLQSIACAMLRRHARGELTEVLYRGGTQAMQDVATGDIDLYFALGNTAAEHVAAGRARAIASTHRTPRAGGLPLLSASLPGFVLMGWQAVVLPAGTPAEIAVRLHREIAAALAEPRFRERLAVLDVEPVAGPPEDLARLLREDLVRFRRIAREAGLRGD